MFAMKRLRFSEPLVRMVLDGSKDTTWRIDDEKLIEQGDILSLARMDGSEFARVTVLWTHMTTFKDLRLQDKEGHEKFSTEKEMYDTYSRYYSMSVHPGTPLKVIKFAMLRGAP